ncbi:hypothetical protein CWI38_2616p0010 [Hamiltosporidium tvaerminnensis]|uniref:Uncharacterized protein n=1 Tax=Hamiltosporidium tvaerminnensis TaxID=1176355 RepID=A0A4Q9LE38_9MICR|nr:hypothetical protein CWI38_2616p0010 [Hamiltosporidium tvaerminnensis]
MSKNTADIHVYRSILQSIVFKKKIEYISLDRRRELKLKQNAKDCCQTPLKRVNN